MAAPGHHGEWRPTTPRDARLRGVWHDGRVPRKRVTPEKLSPELPGKAGIVAPIVASVIDSLGVGASFYLAPTQRTHGGWFPIRLETGVIALEHHARKLPLRWSRDERVLLRVRREGRTIVARARRLLRRFRAGRQGGRDLRNVGGGAGRKGASDERRDSAEIQHRHRAPSARERSDLPRLREPDPYDAHARGRAVRWVSSLPRVLCLSCPGAQNIDALVRELDELRPKVLAARSAEDMWKQTHDLLAERVGGPIPEIRASSGASDWSGFPST